MCGIIVLVINAIRYLLMKLPANKVEIMDAVASLAVDKTMSMAEKGSQMRLALFHWKYVPDKTDPTIEYDGFDIHSDSPITELDLNALIEGAPDYIDERSEELNMALKSVSEQLLAVEERSRNPVGTDSVSKMNELYKEKAKIVEQLGDFNYQIIDRVVSFDLYDSGLSATNADIKARIKNIINSDSDLEVGVDMEVVENRNSVEFKFYLNNAQVENLVPKITELFEDKYISDHSADVTIRDYNPSLPSFKTTADQRKMNLARERLKEEGFEPSSI